MDGVLFNKSQTTLLQCPAGSTGHYSIPGGVTSIGDSAFSDCTSLTSVTIPASITALKRWVFRDCPSLGYAYFQGDAPEDSGAFVGGPATIYYLPGTTGWGLTYSGRPTALWVPLTLGEPPLTTAGPLRLRSTAPAPASVRVQRSVNLRDWEDWRTLSRDEGPSELQDAEAGAVPCRLYRLVGE